TVVSLGFACLSTIIGFGLLAFSRVPLLSAIGSTVGTGAMLALIFSAALAGARERRPAPGARLAPFGARARGRGARRGAPPGRLAVGPRDARGELRRARRGGILSAIGAARAEHLAPAARRGRARRGLHHVRGRSAPGHHAAR